MAASVSLPERQPKARKPRILRQVRRTRRLVALLWPYARPHKRLLLTGAVLSAAGMALRAAQPWPLKWVVDRLAGSPSHHDVLPWLAGHAHLDFAALAALYVLLSLLAAWAEYGQLLALAGLGNRVMFSFRAALFAQVLRQSLGFHEKRETGELLTRIVYDTARLRQGVNGILTRIFLTVFMFLVTLGILLWLDPPLASIVGVTGLLALVTMGHGSRRIFRASRKQRKREGRVAAVVAEKLLGIRELQTFRPGDAPDKRFERHNLKSLKQEQKVRRLAAGLLVRVELLLAFSVTLLLWLGGRAVEAGRLTPGDLVLFVSYAAALYRPFTQFARQTARSGKTFASADRLAKIMGKEPAIRDLPGAIVAPPFRGHLTIESVSTRSLRRRDPTRQSVLEGISLQVEPGERVGIVGHNGAGKSTLLRLVLRLLDPDQGRVLMDGRDLRGYTLDSLRSQISVVFQDSVFFGMSVRENIALGHSDAGLTEIQQAAERCCMQPFIERLHDGYDTVVRQRGRLFSVGERQRIALARALLRDGRIWLLDEPTSGLDPTTAQELVSLLLEATEGRTVLWVTHDLRILPTLDRILVLNEGQLAFLGTPVEYGAWLAQQMGGTTKLHEEKVLRTREP